MQVYNRLSTDDESALTVQLVSDELSDLIGSFTTSEALSLNSDAEAKRLVTSSDKPPFLHSVVSPVQLSLPPTVVHSFLLHCNSFSFQFLLLFALHVICTLYR